MSIYESQLLVAAAREVGRRGTQRRPQDVGSSAEPHDVLQTKLSVKQSRLDEALPPPPPPPPLSRNAALSSPPFSDTQTHAVICISFSPLLSPLKHVRQGSTTAWRAKVTDGRLVGERMGKYTRLFSFFFIFFSSFSPMCAVVDHIDCTSIW